MGQARGAGPHPGCAHPAPQTATLCSRSGQAEIWSSTLAKEWLEGQAPDDVGVSTPTAMCASTPASSQNCRVATSPGTTLSAQRRRVPGSMPWTGSPFFWSHAL